MYISARQLTVALTILCGALVAQALSARPTVIHEQARVSLPEPYYGVFDVCLQGNDMLAVSGRTDPVYSNDTAWVFVHFRKQTDGEWQFVGELTTERYNAYADYWTTEDFTCEGGLAAFSGPDRFSIIFELTPAGWQASRVDLGAGYPSGVAIHGDTVAFSGRWQAPATIALVKKDASGQWTDITYLVGNPGQTSEGEIQGPYDMEFAGTEAIAIGADYYPPNTYESVRDTQLFDLVEGVWQVTTLPYDSGVTIINERIGLTREPTWTVPGEAVSIYSRDSAGAWTVKHSMFSDEVLNVSDVIVHGDRIFASNSNAGAVPRVIGEIAVFDRQAERSFTHVAMLSASDTPAEQYDAQKFSVDGEWVAMAKDRTIYLFHVPADLPAEQRLEETFEDNNAAEWVPWGTADWQIVDSGGSRAYRQTSTTGGARAILSTFESADQSIQADVRIDSMAGPSPWAGFMVRYTDPQNFYYLLVDRTSVQIRRMQNGVYGPIATAPFDLELGRTYRFRIEAIGAQLRAFVNGELVTEALDETHPQGNVALTMWRSATEYDNIVVTTSPQATLLADDFSQGWPGRPRPWTTNSSTWSFVSNGDVTTYRQSSLSGRLTAVNGGPTGDQIVSAEVRPRTFNGLASAGLTARYVDEQNHYFVVLTSDHRVALRKRIKGATYRIGDAPLTVTPGASYRVRLEVIGSSIRAYVDDELVLEAQDGALPTGRYGLMAFQAAVDFDSFVAIRP